MTAEMGSNRRKRKPKNSGRVEFNTPLYCLIALEPMTVLSTFGLDPCWNERSDVIARVTFDESQNGLDKDWLAAADGELAYVNPPYGDPLKKEWAPKMVAEAERGLEMVSLVPASPETGWYRALEDTATARCVPPSRLVFKGMDSGAFFGSTFFYHGERGRLFERCMRVVGHVKQLKPCEPLTREEIVEAWQVGIKRRLAHHSFEDRARLIQRIEVAIQKHNVATGYGPIPEDAARGLSWRKLYRIACG